MKINLNDFNFTLITFFSLKLLKNYFINIDV
jgi:hypothetical protein